MTSKASIRKAKQSDTKTLVEMVVEICKYEEKVDKFKALDRSRFKEFRKYISDGVKEKKGSFILVAEDNKEPVGFVYGEIEKRPVVFKEKKMGEISDIYVSPKYRGTGLAVNLLHEAKKQFKKKGLKYVNLFVLKPNKRAEKAYKKAGFKEYMKAMRKEL